jgi:hypothetical protein
LLLHAPLTAMVLVLMTLTAIGGYGFLTAPIAQRIALAEANARELDGQVAELDAMVAAATRRCRTTGRRVVLRRRIHKTLKVTPAMAAKVTSRLWEIGDIVDVLESWEISRNGEGMRP